MQKDEFKLTLWCYPKNREKYYRKYQKELKKDKHWQGNQIDALRSCFKALGWHINHLDANSAIVMAD